MSRWPGDFKKKLARTDSQVILPIPSHGLSDKITLRVGGKSLLGDHNTFLCVKIRSNSS